MKGHRQKSWGDDRSAKGSTIERHSPRHHRLRALRRAPVREVPPAEEARGERQTYHEVSAKDVSLDLELKGTPRSSNRDQ